MSFQNNSIWLPNGSGSVADRQMLHETSTRIDQKRPHRWFMDSSEQELFLSKKQAVPFKVTSGIAILESSLCGGSQSQTPSLFSPKPVQISNVSDDNSITPIMASKHMENKEPGNQFGNDPSTCLTLSREVNCSFSLNSGTRNVKVNEARISENCFPEFVGSTFTHGKKNESMPTTFQRTGNNMFSGPTHNTAVGNAILMDPAYSKIDKNCVSVGNSSNEREGNFMLTNQCYNGIAFRGFQNNVEERDRSGRIISSYGVLLNQSSTQFSGALGHKNSMDQPRENAILASSSRADCVPKNEDRKTKKRSLNNFPSNVKSFLSTGILDGVPVKYVSWSREKSLRAVVKVTGYLCSCQDCKFSKIINAYEFELHAGCKTKHPNNHIYFENGKSIYAVVQELKSTPREMLFDVIQNVTGSAVNQKYFNDWKASYEISTHEVERVFGQGDLVPPS